MSRLLETLVTYLLVTYLLLVDVGLKKLTL